MLSEEEKKAIKKLNEILKEWQEIINIEDETEREIEMLLYLEEMPFEEINTVLNITTKLQKENEEKDRKIEKYLDIISKNIIETIKDELVQQKNKEIDLKDKQIDLMAEYISKRDVEEDICMKNKTNPDWCNEDYTNCQGCIKKYFAGLVEKE